MVRAFFDARDGATLGAIAQARRPLQIDPLALTAFLHLSYVPGNRTLFTGVDCLPGGCEIELAAGGWRVARRHRYVDDIDPELQLRSATDLETLGARAFRNAVERSLAKTGTNVVPLSGGMDSRAVLGALLELTSPQDIHTYTYGIPGSADFELGNRVARVAGTRHSVVDMRQVVFDVESLIAIARLTDANACVFHPYVWHEIRRRYGADASYWSGFTGDGLGGSFFQPRKGSSDEAVTDFVRGESVFSAWKSAAQPRERIAELVARETKYDELLSPHEAVWFENHVERYTAHQIFMVGLDYRAPFMDRDFTRFMLGVGPRHRTNKTLFNRMISRAFPKLFALPTRDYGYSLAHRPVRHLGWKAKNISRKVLYRLAPAIVTHPNVSYTDFNVAMRERADIKNATQELLEGLKRRSLLDRTEIERLWQQHQAGQRCEGTLMMLASLEANARAFCD